MHQMTTHAVPPMGDDLRWLDEQLQVFAQLFAPTYELGPETRQFLTALRNAIDDQLRDNQSAT
jgi:hypothetical protein